MFAVESGNGQSYNPVTCIRNTLHFHSSFGTYEEDFGVGAQLFMALAMEIAGKICPPVPPPLMISLTL